MPSLILHADARLVKNAKQTLRRCARHFQDDGAQRPRRRRACLQEVFSDAGSLPPLCSSFIMTCLCSQIFIEAESFMSP